MGVGRRWVDAGQARVVLSILTLSALPEGAFTLFESHDSAKTAHSKSFGHHYDL